MQISPDSGGSSSSDNSSGKFAFKSDGSQPSIPAAAGKGKPVDFANIGVIVFAVIAILFFAFAVSTFMGGGTKTTTDTQLQPQGSEKEIAALVNGTPIYLADANARYNAVPAELKSQYTLRSIVDNMVDNLLLQQEAQKEGITVSDQELEQAWASQAEEAATISQQTGISELEIKQSLKEYLIVQKLIQAKTANIAPPEVTEAEAQKYYTDNEADLNSIALKVRASHILVDDNVLAAQILDEIKKGGDFNALVAKYSKDTATVPRGGDLGYFSKGDMVPEFENAAFATDINAVYPDIVQSQFGYHIIKVTDRVQGYDAIKNEIIQFLGQQKQTDAVSTALKEYIAQLRAAANIEIKLQ
jgi:parvulin-like peptidyl-prolyl isomerase